MLLVVSLALIFSGHLLRVWRWSLLARPFVAARNGHYFLALAAGHSLNAILPLRMGEIARAWLFSRLGRIPFSQSLGTVIADRIADILFITNLYLVLVFAELVPFTIPGFVIAVAILIGLPVGACLLVRDSRFIKAPLAAFAGLFNTDLQRGLLAVGWSTRQVLAQATSSPRTILTFSILTLAMWGAYFAAIAAFTAFLGTPFLPTGSLTLWSQLYLTSPGLPPLAMPHGFSSLSPVTLYLLLGTLPLIAITLYLLVRNWAGLHKTATSSLLRLNLFLQPEDERAFLSTWASSKNPTGLLTAFEENQDVAIIRDLSGGSQAHTLLAQKNDSVFYRKYALGEDEAARLAQQKDWIDTHNKHLALPPVLRTKQADGYFSYDMPFDPSAYTFYEYVHTHPVSRSWPLLQTILADLEHNLYQRTRRVETTATAEAFVREKLIAPVHKSIAASPQLAELAQYQEIIVNGQTVPNAPAMLSRIDVSALARSFNLARICTPHGDLTLENIIYSPSHPSEYYLIDPLTPNILESQYLDAGKLLQSLHVGYEFLTHLRRVNVNGNTINFPVTTSQQYTTLCNHLIPHLQNTYGESGWREIQLMEVIQVARLLPYRVRHQPHAAAAYYGIYCQLLDAWLRQAATVKLMPAA